MKIKAGDKVMVLSGKYRGRTGKVMRVYKKQGKATVEKINIVVRHIRKTTTRPGEKITFEAPMPICKLMVVCPQCEKFTRVAYTKVEKKGKVKKQRICRKCKQALDEIPQAKSKKK